MVPAARAIAVVLGAELGDLLHLGLAQLARQLALGNLRALHVVPYPLDHLGVGKRRDVADIREVGHGRDYPAHDLPRPGLRHVRDDPDVLRPGDLANLDLDGAADLRLDTVRRRARLQRDVHLHDAAPDVVDHRNRGGLGNLGDGQRGGLELLGTEPVPGHVDDVVDPAENPEVAVRGLSGPVVCEVRPIPPVRAVGVPVVLRVIRGDEPVGVSPDRLEDPRPRVADADIAGPAAGYLVAVLVVDHGVDAEHPGATATRLHRLQRRECAAEEAAVLGLPPGVDDHRFALADLAVA